MFRKDESLTLEEKYRRIKRKFRIVSSLLVLCVLCSSFYIYQNYDYLVLKHLISQNYIYTDTLDTLYTQMLGENPEGEYYKYFDVMVASVLTAVIRSINNDRYTYVYTPESYQNMKASDKEEADESFLEEVRFDTIYVKLSNFSSYTRDFMVDSVPAMQKYPNLVLDLRGNLGGSTDALNEIADLFLEKGTLIAIDEARVALFTEVTKAKHPAQLYFEHIIILQDQNSASASEGLIAALSENLDTVTLVGETTFGKGIGQVTIPVTKGYALKATAFQWKTPKGNTIHGKGIEPDIAHDPKDENILDVVFTIIDE